MPEGGNEITAARALLETLALEGMLVAGDATHAQVAPAGIIRDRGGDYLLALKANHPLLLAEITTTDALAMAGPRPATTA